MRTTRNARDRNENIWEKKEESSERSYHRTDSHLIRLNEY